MEFKPVKAEDKEKITEYLKHAKARSCDMTFANIYLWKDFYEATYAEVDGTIVVRSGGNRVSFSFPIGEGEAAPVIEQLKEHCKEENIPLVFHNISKGMEQYLEEHYPGQFEVEYHRDDADYIYETEALIALRGRKYHGKKNHINKFKKTFDWTYEEITEENTKECMELLQRWKEENCTPADIEKHAEICVSEAALTHKDSLGLKGGLLRANGKVVAFSIGERLNEDTFCVHIEKAYADVPGAYPMINQQFLIHEAGDCKYVNREDDVGNPGLRKAKLSYHPVFLEEKAIAIYKES
ncbi:MAG: phosphatidylglycerol lysyltransferase domain-containing protein [Eubacteriales bacterium]|nr:phosphatidylglycerol lysyltransferase domain-containing protein [Eubacteriales bacterium]